LGELLQIVGVMQSRFSVILSGSVLLIGMQVATASAQDKLQAFLNSSGKVVFTNLVENAPAVVPETPKTEVSPAQEMPASLGSLVDTISSNHGVDPALVRALIKTESNFNRFAVSNKGALGLMQLIPSTGRRYGVRDFFDPQQNIDGGVRHLKFLLEKFNGNLDLSLAAYNAGENLVERLGRVPSIPETTNYVRKIRAIYQTKSTPITARSLSAQGQTMVAASAPEPPKIYKSVDARGVVHFSNIEPPN
jgi:soluble lytic murein transglycosylase-like protein